MKNHSRTQFLKQLTLLVFGLFSVSLIYAQLDIPTNINNAVQTIQTIVVTDNGRSDGNKVMILNSGGTASALQVSGSVVAGRSIGSDETLLNRIIGEFSSILAGFKNKIFGSYSAILGGDTNVLTGNDSVILGGQYNTVSGAYSTAGGRRAQAAKDYTWVWSDKDNAYDPADFIAARSNTFLIRAKNGVGINTANPLYTLDVNGDIEANGWLRTIGNVGWLSQTHGGGWYMTDSSWIRTYGSKNIYQNAGILRTDGELQVGPNGDRFVVNSAGNVGIGKSNPTYKLDVAGNARVSAGDSSYVFFGPNATWGAQLYVGATPDKSGTGIAQVIATDGNLHLDSATSKGIYMNYYKPGNINMVANGGNVGIGLVTAHSKLEVNGNIVTTAGYNANSGLPAMYDIGGRAMGATTSIYSYGSICANNNSAECNGANGVVLGTVNTAAQTNIPTNGNVFFNNGSNVGIGTTSPGSKLEVAGGIIVNGPTAGSTYTLFKNAGTSIGIFGSDASIYGGTATNMGLYVYGANQFDLSTNGSKRFSVTSAGNVGIGTTSPSKALVVQKTSSAPAIMVGGALPGSPRIQTYSLDADGNAWMGLGADMAGGSYEHSLYFPALGFQTIGTYNGTTYSEKMRIKNDGNVGIGITTPLTKLQVAGDVSVTSAPNGIHLANGYNNGWYGVNLVGEDNGVNGHDLKIKGRTTPTGAFSDLLTVKNSGNVGIGTNTPNYKLQVEGTASFANENFVINNDGTMRSPSFNTFPAEVGNHWGGLNVGIDSYSIYEDGDGKDPSGNNGFMFGQLGSEPLMKLYPNRVNFIAGISSPGFVATGVGVTANGKHATAMGYNTQANGKGSLAAGGGSIANQAYSVAMGFETQTNGQNALAVGDRTQANGRYSVAMGDQTMANGEDSMAIGTNTKANAPGSFVGGYYTIANEANSMSMGQYNLGLPGSLFELGNGIDDANRSNAFSVNSVGDIKIAANSSISHSNQGSFGSAAGVIFDANGNEGLILETDRGDSESAGIFMNGNTIKMWNPGDDNFLDIYDEDDMSPGNLPAPKFSIDGDGGVSSRGSLTVDGGATIGGNVGIGTNSPTSKLQVLGGTIRSDLGAVGTSFIGTAPGSNIQIMHDGTANVRFYNSATNGTFSFMGANSSMGNVGIGTNTPGKTLDVVGTIRASTSIETPLLIVDKLVNRTVSNITVSGQLLPDTNAPASSQTIGSAATPWKSLYANELYLSGLVARGTAVTADGGSTAMGSSSTAWNGSMALGFGSSASYSSMAIGSATNASYGSYAFGNTITAIYGGYGFGVGVNANGNIAIGKYNVGVGGSLLEIGNGTSSSARSNAMTILANGNVGIGTTTPSASAKLDVVGNIYADADWTNDRTFRIREGADDNYGAFFKYGLGDTLSIGTRNGTTTDVPAMQITRGSPNVYFNGYINTNIPEEYPGDYGYDPQNVMVQWDNDGWIRKIPTSELRVGYSNYASEADYAYNAGNAYQSDYASNLNATRSNWNSYGTISAVVGQLAWKNYGNNHTIFDASAGTSPSGTAINKSNAQVAWTASYPTLMGWNGSTTYGVRVDSARVADYASSAGSASRADSAGNADYAYESDSAYQMYNPNYGGGWYMADSSWIRTYGGKNIYQDTGILRTDGQLQVGPNGDRFLVNQAGNVGIGTNAPSRKFTIQANHGDTQLLLHSLGGGSATTEADMMLWASEPNHTWNGVGISNNVYNTTNFPRINTARGGSYMRLLDNSINFSTVDSAGTTATPLIVGSSTVTVAGNVLAGGYFYSSDITLKKDITSIDNALVKINKLNGYSFTWKATDKKDIGVIAQEVEKVFPEIVHTDKEGIKSVEYGNLVAPIIEAIKSLTQKVENLFAKYVDQEARINALEQRLQKLEAHK